MALSSLTTSGVCLILNNTYSRSVLWNGKLRTFKKLYQPSSPISGKLHNVCFKREASTNKFVPFDEIMQQRRNEAQRTVVVQIQGKNGVDNLIDHCLKFGNINSVHYYKLTMNWHHALLEFESDSSIEDLLKSASYADLNASVPTYSHFLWLKNNLVPDGARSKFAKVKEKYGRLLQCQSRMTEAQVLEKIGHFDNLSYQMNALHECLKLDETDTRLRFVTAHQIEKSISCLFPNVQVLPFGSSINGCGKHGSDLDLVMSFNNLQHSSNDSKLVLHTKSWNDERIKTRVCMETIADQLKHLLPGIMNVRKILNARVPIIRYSQIFTGLECDLSMTNMTGVYMSELLYLYGELDNRTRPLIFTIRKWAARVGLTYADAPTERITNFSLTLLVIYFLQQQNVLPSLNKLKLLAGAADVREADRNVDCTFLRDLTNFSEKTETSQSLEELLIEFFKYYAAFDFANYAISIMKADKLKKPDFSPLYICNPLEVGLNVSRNVSLKEVNQFNTLCDLSAKTLTKSASLINLFDPKMVTQKSKKTFNVNIQDIFDVEKVVNQKVKNTEKQNVSKKARGT